MLETLKPVVRQLDETYEALHISLNKLTDEHFAGCPAATRCVPPSSRSTSRAAVTYSTVIGPTLHTRLEMEPEIDRAELVRRIPAYS